MKKLLRLVCAVPALLVSFQFSAAALGGVSFSELLSQAPVSAAEAALSGVSVPAVQPPLKAGLQIEPGTDLTPLMQDRIRVRAILKLVEDVYYNRPLPYSQDGTTFKNKEGRLPQQPVGFYKEYTLLTGNAPHTVVIDGKTYQVAPDLSARGSERVIIGGGRLIYYTPDHYANFIQFTVVR